ncbi:MAG TPA: ribonuclease III [Syntrophomonadaceae bacterium]|mgnify:CR=1 FL=1|jgi:ribonuclease-3|nr:ribonuclease III [Syntrophomonadaceae bacterium]HRX20432.1 ribonuclease III [Syntrophomonadaceae bacterium]
MANKTDDFAAAQGLEFNSMALLTLALTHPSYHQDKNLQADNQRLEFLGDAVLNLAITEALFERLPDQAEGELTKIRAKIVCEKALLQIARGLNLGSYLLLGKGEEMSGGRSRKSILADAVEAVIGAIYLDKGYDAARSFIWQHFQEVISQASSGDYNDYKSKLQEIVQAKNRQSVNYVILEESGPAHAKIFTAGVYYQKTLLAVGRGKSKKEAEQNAAEKALEDESKLQQLLKMSV